MRSAASSVYAFSTSRQTRTNAKSISASLPINSTMWQRRDSPICPAPKMCSGLKSRTSRTNRKRNFPTIRRSTSAKFTLVSGSSWLACPIDGNMLVFRSQTRYCRFANIRHAGAVSHFNAQKYKHHERGRLHVSSHKLHTSRLADRQRQHAFSESKRRFRQRAVSGAHVGFKARAHSSLSFSVASAAATTRSRARRARQAAIC